MRSLWRLCLLALCISCYQTASGSSDDFSDVDFGDSDGWSDIDPSNGMNASDCFGEEDAVKGSAYDPCDKGMSGVLYVFEGPLCTSDATNPHAAYTPQRAASFGSEQESDLQNPLKRTRPPPLSYKPGRFSGEKSRTAFDTGTQKSAGSFSPPKSSENAVSKTDCSLESSTSNDIQTKRHRQQEPGNCHAHFSNVFNRLRRDCTEILCPKSQRINWKFVIATDDSISHLSHRLSKAELQILCGRINQKTADSIQVMPREDILLYLKVCEILLERYQHQTHSPSARKINWNLAVLTEIPENYKNETFNNDTILTRGFYQDLSLIDKITFVPQFVKSNSDILMKLQDMERNGNGSSAEAKKMRAFLWLAELYAKYSKSTLRNVLGKEVCKRLKKIVSFPEHWTLKELEQVERAQAMMNQMMKPRKIIVYPSQASLTYHASTILVSRRDLLASAGSSEPPLSVSHSTTQVNEKSSASPFEGTWREEAPDDTPAGNLFKQLQDKFKRQVPNQSLWCMLYCPCENWPDNVARYYKFWDRKDLETVEKWYNFLVFTVLTDYSSIALDLSFENAHWLLLQRFRYQSGLKDATVINWNFVNVSGIPSKYHIDDFNSETLAMPHIRGTFEIIRNINFRRLLPEEIRVFRQQHLLRTLQKSFCNQTGKPEYAMEHHDLIGWPDRVCMTPPWSYDDMDQIELAMPTIRFELRKMDVHYPTIASEMQCDPPIAESETTAQTSTLDTRGFIYECIQQRFNQQTQLPAWQVFYARCPQWPDDIARHYKFWNDGDAMTMTWIINDLTFGPPTHEALMPIITQQMAFDILLQRFKDMTGRHDAVDIDWSLVNISLIPEKYHITSFDERMLLEAHIYTNPEIVNSITFNRPRAEYQN